MAKFLRKVNHKLVKEIYSFLNFMFEKIRIISKSTDQSGTNSGEDINFMSKIISLNQLKITYLDVGANKGEYYELLFNNTKTEHEVIMVEPIKEFFQALAKKYHNKSNIKLYNCCLGNEKKNVIIYRKGEGGSMHYSSEDLRVKSKYISSQTVPMVLGDEIIKDLDVSLIKIDTDGNDFFCLQGLSTTLNMHPLITFEHSNKLSNKAGYKLRDVQFFLSKHGYSIYVYEKDRIKKVKFANLECLGARTKNFLAIHNSGKNLNGLAMKQKLNNF